LISINHTQRNRKKKTIPNAVRAARGTVCRQALAATGWETDRSLMKTRGARARGTAVTRTAAGTYVSNQVFLEEEE
jgi:hypothetical protein